MSNSTVAIESTFLLLILTALMMLVGSLNILLIHKQLMWTALAIVFGLWIVGLIYYKN
jgi:hypothetical protein